MNGEELKEWFEEKYQQALGMSFEEWIEVAPQSEDQAYERLQEIDEELKNTEEEYQTLKGEEKWELGEYREKLRNEYQMLEEMFGLGNTDE